MIAVVCLSFINIHLCKDFILANWDKKASDILSSLKNILIVLADSLQLLYTKIQNKVGKNVVISQYAPTNYSHYWRLLRRKNIFQNQQILYACKCPLEATDLCVKSRPLITCSRGK